MKKRKLFYSRWYGWVGLAALVISAAVFCVSIWYLTDTIFKDTDYIRIKATVVDIVEVRTTSSMDSSSGGGERTLYSEIAEYTVNGVKYRAQNNSASTAPKKIGSKIRVAYNPENPEDCFFPTSNYPACVVMFVLGGGFLACGTYLMCLEAKERKMEKLTKRLPNAKFITSAANKAQFIQTDKPVIAVCGKSNVGKSSFINMLAGQNKLARVSKDPGRTRLVNYFDFGSFVLADLPGYGFARVSKTEKQKWAHLLDDFFALKCASHVFALADIRHDPTADDKQMIEYLYYNLIPFTVIATKADKLSKAAAKRGVQNIAATFKCGAGDVIATSAETRQGLEAVLDRIESVINLKQENGDDNN